MSGVILGMRKRPTPYTHRVEKERKDPSSPPRLSSKGLVIKGLCRARLLEAICIQGKVSRGLFRKLFFQGTHEPLESVPSHCQARRCCSRRNAVGLARAMIQQCHLTENITRVEYAYRYRSSCSCAETLYLTFMHDVKLGSSCDGLVLAVDLLPKFERLQGKTIRNSSSLLVRQIFK